MVAVGFCLSFLLEDTNFSSKRKEHWSILDSICDSSTYVLQAFSILLRKLICLGYTIRFPCILTATCVRKWEDFAGD